MILNCFFNTLGISNQILQVIGKNGGEDTLAHWPALSGIKTIDEASAEVLKYLEKVWSSLSTSGNLSHPGRCSLHKWQIIIIIEMCLKC